MALKTEYTHRRRNRSSRQSKTLMEVVKNLKCRRENVCYLSNNTPMRGYNVPLDSHRYQKTKT